MIIIDEGAIGKLIQALKSLSDVEGRHCIRIYPTGGDVRQQITAQAQEHLPSANLYFCEDGEAFLLAQASVKECKKAMLEIAGALGVQPADDVGELYDLGLQIGALVILLEKKAENRRRAEEESMRRQVQQETAERTAQRRKEMLELPGAARDMNAQRKKRGKPELMIIEDDPFSRRLVNNVLAKQFRMTELATAEDALSTYAELAPDMLLLDINLPDVTGHELLEKIMALDPSAYVVMLSGNADRTNVTQAMERGAAGFVAKPFSRDKLFQYIERCPTIEKENRI